MLWRLVRNRDRRSLYPIIMLFFLLLPSTASIAFPVENPSFGRASAAVPIVCIIAAIPFALLLGRVVDALRNVAPHR